MSEIDPNTGLPVIPSFLFNEKTPDWRWYVYEHTPWTERGWYSSEEKTRYIVSLQRYTMRTKTKREEKTVEIPRTWWDRLWNLPVKTETKEVFVDYKEIDWVAYWREEIPNLTEEDILAGAEKIMAAVLSKFNRDSLLGAYPPKRLDTVGETE